MRSRLGQPSRLATQTWSRRALLALVAPLMVGVLAVTLTDSFVHAMPRQSTRGVAAPPRAPSPQRTTAQTLSTPTPAAIAYVQPDSVSFDSAQDGWLLGNACDLQQHCAVAVVRTSDGGAAWSVVASPQVTADGSAQILAASPRDAWIWGSDSSGRTFLFATHNGGSSWHGAAPSGATVLTVAITANTIWVDAGCAATTSSCRMRMLSSPVTSERWTELGTLPASMEQPEISNVQPGPQLVRVASRAWLLNANAAHPALIRSDDGGHTWSQMALPCTVFEHMVLGASSPADVMLACAHFGGWPAPQEVWTSNDGGSDWLLRSRAWFNDGMPGPPDVGRLDNNGAPTGLDVVSSTTAWMTNDRGDDLATHDDGVTWTDAALPQDDFGGGGGALGVTFTDPEHGWTWTGAELWMTRDGGTHWRYEPVVGPVPGY